MKDHSKFDNSGCFTCSECRKKTRHTSVNDGLELCPTCTRLIEVENLLNDGVITKREHDDWIEKIKKEGSK